MEPSPELLALLERYYAASAQGDTSFLKQLIAPDAGALIVGTDASEWWQGGEHIVQTWSAAWRTRGGLPVRESHASAFRSGAVGWVADQALWLLPDGRTQSFRLTAVFEQRGGAWRMVQAHFSVGVPNEQLG